MPAFLIVMGLLFVAALFLDAQATIFATRLPDNVRIAFELITQAGDSIWTLLPSLLATIFFIAFARFAADKIIKQKAKTIASVAGFAFSAIALPGIFTLLVKRLVGRARPVHFEELGVFNFQPIFNDWSFQSFPSGHATTIFAFAVAVLFLVPRAAKPAMLLAAVVGFSRIIVGAHYPSDVLGGVIVGVFGAYAVRNFCVSRNWLFKRTPDGQISLDLNWPSAT